MNPIVADESAQTDISAHWSWQRSEHALAARRTRSTRAPWTSRDPPRRTRKPFALALPNVPRSGFTRTDIAHLLCQRNPVIISSSTNKVRCQTPGGSGPGAGNHPAASGSPSVAHGHRRTDLRGAQAEPECGYRCTETPWSALIVTLGLHRAAGGEP